MPFMLTIITTCTCVKLLGPCFKTGQKKYICIHKQVANNNHLCNSMRALYALNINQYTGVHVFMLGVFNKTRMHEHMMKHIACIMLRTCDNNTAYSYIQLQTTISACLCNFICFLFNNFKHCLTFFSKSFSQFPHGTY